MQDELLVLNAILRLARRRVPATLREVDARVGGPARRVRAALARLVSLGLVQRTASAIPQLTMEGFALAVALARSPRSRTRRTAVARPATRAA